jgi:hypothetical protein
VCVCVCVVCVVCVCVVCVVCVCVVCVLCVCACVLCVCVCVCVCVLCYCFFVSSRCFLDLLKPTVYSMHQQFNIQEVYILSAVRLCVLYLSQKQTANFALHNTNYLVFITD